ncbi:MAG: GTPase Era [Flavobacteriales bacterium]|nr:GTPase Era [Flavobacteriales bacterium]MCZ2443374.1 GTPase Era [Flavobacteriales bacterium]
MEHKAGYVNIFGKPNAGKSTLLNALIGEKLSTTNQKAQTTRHRILGIYNDALHQIIFSDSPGIIEPKYKLQERMMHQVTEQLEDADVYLLVIDATNKQSVNPEDSSQYQAIIGKICQSDIPLVIALNKIDSLSQEKVYETGEKLRSLYPKAHILGISALHHFQIDELRQLIQSLLPIHPPYYDKDDVSDRDLRFFCAEIIREKIMGNYDEEVPYSSHVVINSFKEEEKLIRIHAEIYVERESQKAIIIGKMGKALKKTATESRIALEEFLKAKVFLELFVKVKKDWRSNENLLNNMGYC